MKVSKEYRFEAAHRLRFHQGGCRNIHGHSYKLVVETEGGVQPTGPATGMVLDFKTLSNCVNSILEGDEETPFDHAIILNAADPLVNILNQMAEPLRIVLMNCEPTAENMAHMFAGLIQSKINLAFEGEVIPLITKVEVWETAKAKAVWERG